MDGSRPGTENVLQLEGGILGYFEQVGGEGYDGRIASFSTSAWPWSPAAEGRSVSAPSMGYCGPDVCTAGPVRGLRHSGTGSPHVSQSLRCCCFVTPMSSPPRPCRPAPSADRWRQDPVDGRKPRTGDVARGAADLQVILDLMGRRPDPWLYRRPCPYHRRWRRSRRRRPVCRPCPCRVSPWRVSPRSIGVLGTDDTTRSTRELVATVNGLRNEGLNALRLHRRLPPAGGDGDRQRARRSRIHRLPASASANWRSAITAPASPPSMNCCASLPTPMSAVCSLARRAFCTCIWAMARADCRRCAKRSTSARLPARVFKSHPHQSPARELFEEAVELARRGCTDRYHGVSRRRGRGCLGGR